MTKGLTSVQQFVNVARTSRRLADHVSAVPERLNTTANRQGGNMASGNPTPTFPVNLTTSLHRYITASLHHYIRPNRTIKCLMNGCSQTHLEKYVRDFTMLCTSVSSVLTIELDISRSWKDTAVKDSNQASRTYVYPLSTELQSSNPGSRARNPNLTLKAVNGHL